MSPEGAGERTGVWIDIGGRGSGRGGGFGGEKRAEKENLSSTKITCREIIIFRVESSRHR